MPIFSKYASLLKWKGKKKKKLYTEEEKAINLERIRKAIDKVLAGKWIESAKHNAFLKLRVIAAIILGCTTGLRPTELERLTIKQVKNGLKNRYFILEEWQTKTPFERLIPINKESYWILNELISIIEKKKKELQIRSDKLFPEGQIKKAFTKTKIGIERDNLRDFEVYYSQNKLNVPGFLEAIIAGHDTEKYEVRIENYLKGKVSKAEIRDDWLKYWDDVEILTARQRKEVQKLIDELKG